MAACTDVRYDTAGDAYRSLLEADASKRPPGLHPCLDCRGWHLTPRRMTRAQWLTRRRQQTAEQAAERTGVRAGVGA
jgi:hypothetical protein